MLLTFILFSSISSEIKSDTNVDYLEFGHGFLFKHEMKILRINKEKSSL